MPREIRDSIYELVVGGGNALHISDSKEKLRYCWSCNMIRNVHQMSFRPWHTPAPGAKKGKTKPMTDTYGSFTHRICKQTGPIKATYTFCCRTSTHKAGAKAGTERRYTVDHVLGEAQDIEEYEALGKDYSTVEPIRCSGVGSEKGGLTQLNLSLLRVSQQVYNEAREILYTSNTFTFNNHLNFAKFFDITLPIGPSFGRGPPKPATEKTVVNMIGDTITETLDNSVISKRSSIKHIQLYTEFTTAAQKANWIKVLNAAPFVVPTLSSLVVVLDVGNGCSNWSNENYFHGFKTLQQGVIHMEAGLYYGEEEGWSGTKKKAVAEKMMDVLFQG